MDDGLKVQKFDSKSNINFTSVNNDTPRKITTSNGNKKYKLIPIAIMTVIAFGVGKTALYNTNHEQVEHSGDRYSDGLLVHGHDLDETYFVRDYKFVNPLATTEDILNAFKNGEYEDYQARDDGYIKKVDSLQSDEIEKNVSYYNEVCVKFADDYQEREEVMKNQR